MSTILIIVLILLLIGALPTWPHSANWGYVPSGGLGLVLLILLILALTGRLSRSAHCAEGGAEPSCSHRRSHSSGIAIQDQ